MQDNAVCERFGMIHGQFFATYRYSNLHWSLNGGLFGFGDLRDRDIEWIQAGLNDGEVFEGFNEHHGTECQQMPYPMIRITNDKVMFVSELRDEWKRSQSA